VKRLTKLLIRVRRINLLLNILLSTNLLLGVTKVPEIINDFDLSRDEVIEKTNMRGDVVVEFLIDKMGKVGKINVVDTFDLRLNPAIEDAVRRMKFSPALQNGKPVPVRYKLPIVVR
jgi:TonB family protein